MDDWTIGIAMAIILVIGTACIWGLMWIHMRRKYVIFTEQICSSIDYILKGQDLEGLSLDEETLLSKVQMRLKRLSDITEAAALESEEQKRQVQSVVSDIAHQLKTPIANITMYCDTAVREELPDETRKECLAILETQVKKLDSLIQSLLQMSRLENNIITLHPEDNPLINTLLEVTESARLGAQRKKLDLQMECPEELILCYDKKWTAEAIFNIVDNSIKYTDEGGEIRISVEQLEMFTKITVEDTGMGIAPEHINDVCKRFFREDKAVRAEGVGIGLFLTREIIMKQGGFLKIQSEEGKGTKVAVYLPNLRKTPGFGFPI